MSKNTKNSKVMKSATLTLDVNHPTVEKFQLESVNFAGNTASYQGLIVSTVESLRAEGFADDTIRGVLRQAVEDTSLGCCRVHLNFVLRKGKDKGGCGMALERVHAPKTDRAKKEAPPAAKPRASLSSPVKISDPVSLYAALAVDHDPLAIAALAEKLYGLAMDAGKKGIAAPKAK